MENAGHRVVEFLDHDYAPLAKQRIVVICGKGNNGGDGMVVARQLHTCIQPTLLHVVLAGDPAEMHGDAPRTTGCSKPWDVRCLRNHGGDEHRDL